jgi:hypothetical protein
MSTIITSTARNSASTLSTTVSQFDMKAHRVFIPDQVGTNRMEVPIAYALVRSNKVKPIYLDENFTLVAGANPAPSTIRSTFKGEDGQIEVVDDPVFFFTGWDGKQEQEVTRVARVKQLPTGKHAWLVISIPEVAGETLSEETRFLLNKDETWTDARKGSKFISKLSKAARADDGTYPVEFVTRQGVAAMIAHGWKVQVISKGENASMSAKIDMKATFEKYMEIYSR